MCIQLKAHPRLFIQIFLLCPFCLSWFSRTSQSSLFDLKMSNVLWWLCLYWNTWIWDSGFVNGVTFWPLWPSRNHQQGCGLVVLCCSLGVVSTFDVKWINIWKAAGVTLAYVTSSPDRWPSGNINPDNHHLTWHLENMASVRFLMDRFKHQSPVGLHHVENYEGLSYGKHAELYSCGIGAVGPWVQSSLG